MKTDSHLLKLTRRLLEDDPRPDYIIGVAVGVSPNTIRNIRTQKNTPSVILLESLWEFLTEKKIEDLDQTVSATPIVVQAPDQPH